MTAKMNNSKTVEIYTNAPKVYDYKFTEEINGDVATVGDHPVRLVKVTGPSVLIGSQEDRYGSGNYISMDRKSMIEMIDVGCVKDNDDLLSLLKREEMQEDRFA